MQRRKKLKLSMLVSWSLQYSSKGFLTAVEQSTNNVVFLSFKLSITISLLTSAVSHLLTRALFCL